jgi:septum formation protein
VAPVDLQEDAYLLDDPAVAAVNVAVAKARAIEAQADEVVLAADTLVVCDEHVLAKPAHASEARDMLRRLRGRTHRVLSGVALRTDEGVQWCGMVATSVVMREYAPDEVEAYIARGEPFDKAGGYAVQDQAFRPVERLEGCYLNVVGLPLCAVAAGLSCLGREVPPAGAPPCEYCRAGAGVVSIRSAS